MVKEVGEYKLKEISLFVTAANYTERKKIYQALEKTSVQKIPHVHIRHDMREAEMDYLVSRFQSKVFTAHAQYFLKYFKNSKYRKNIFIENNNGQSTIKNISDLKLAGGCCIDLAHFEQFRFKSKKYYELTKEIAKIYPIGCNHLSAVLPDGQSWHRVKQISDLNYLKNIPQQYFSKYINLELANPIKEQLEFKKYIAKILTKQWNKKS
ncbi:MAG: hypothetical protein WCW26_01235 [Candidatus Buchananbacteria bacterium]